MLAPFLTLALISTGLFIIRDSRKPVDDGADDGADFDPRIVKLGRRVAGISSFHPSENS